MVITRIEQAIVDRLRRGLGNMVRTVKSYNGEAEDLAAQIMTLPAVWVTYGGSRIEAVATARSRYQDSAEFVVMAATRSIRNETAQRHGGIDIREVGSNDLVWAVRRLLDGQRLGLGDSRGLTPKAVRPIANHALVANAAVSVFAVEYTLRFNSCALEDGRFPEKTDDPCSPDYLFTKYRGELSEPWPWFEHFDGIIFDPASGAEIPVNLEIKHDEN
ncbi:phage protein Gp37 [Bergeriella denitrificans]|uniref:Putative Gp37-like prophage protein n=1 Tax=Bergeriella denitrificans TaxID=494 RepID=A0A378UG32_BERDE|nr:phage protein Gp37 [Bergeriella denitrificans]STZ76334.1 putative Gp37-like prophage protein [Bergeriella denitrificans]